MFCEKCGTKIDDGCRFCVSCGKAVERDKKKIVSIPDYIIYEINNVLFEYDQSCWEGDAG